jgi:hypothetical protein
MVIPLTQEALILRKKNKRKMTMNNIKNTMCRLSDLTQQQIDILVEDMPDSYQFDFGSLEDVIGVTRTGSWGTWVSGIINPTIVTYTEMMQLLKGKDMNKQTAQEQMAVMQIEMDKLKAIIDKQEAKPEVKTGRVISKADLEYGAYYWFLRVEVANTRMDNDTVDKKRIDMGNAFHDKESAEKYLEYLKLEQELRRAQIAGGGAGGEYCVLLGKTGKINPGMSCAYYEKISFNTEFARDVFRNTHTDEQLTLLIRGV